MCTFTKSNYAAFLHKGLQRGHKVQSQALNLFNKLKILLSIM